MADITLRGHHLRSLFDILMSTNLEEATILKDMSLAWLPHGYSLEFTTEAFLFFKKIIQNPDLTVKLIDTLDDICDLQCPKLSGRCSSPLIISHDIQTIADYGLKIGEIYTARELVKQILPEDFFLDYTGGKFVVKYKLPNL